MSDLIDRQQAIDALDGFRCGTKAAWKVIEDLPSAQPRKKGKWEKDEHYGEGAYVCTHCETIWTTWQIKNMHFCPTCGARMDGESE